MKKLTNTKTQSEKEFNQNMDSNQLDTKPRFVKTQKEIADWEENLLLRFFAYSTTTKGKIVLHSETNREEFENLKNFIKSLLSSYAEQVRKEEREKVIDEIKEIEFYIPLNQVTRYFKLTDEDLQALSSTEQGECKCGCHILGENNPKKCTNENCQEEGKNENK